MEATERQALLDRGEEAEAASNVQAGGSDAQPSGQSQGDAGSASSQEQLAWAAAGRHKSYKSLFLIISSGALLTVVVFLTLVSIVRMSRFPQVGLPPYCRKSSLIAVLPALGSNASQPKHKQELLVWSGMGRHKAVFASAFAFNLAGRHWRRVNTTGDDCPVPRWKAGTALMAAGGLMVVGGDAYTPHTRQHTYTNDIWLLTYPDLEWSQAAVDPEAPAPLPRRGHSSLVYKGEDGLERIVIFGGRTQDKLELNDAWEVLLSWPNATWQRITPQEAHVDKHARAPAPRRGHSAVLLPGDSSQPQMLVYGGRNTKSYFGDLWVLDVRAGSWRQLQPASLHIPPSRDHHAAAIFTGRLVVWGGRSGRTHAEAQAMSDLWTLDLATLVWQEIKHTGRYPLPRFEHSFVQYSRPGSRDSRLLIFGGQTEGVCQLNDVWELSLTTLQWAELSPPKFCGHRCKKAHRRDRSTL